MSYKQADVDESEQGMSRIRGTVPYWTPPEGNNLIRILPPRDDHPDNTYYWWVATHGKLPGANRPVLCNNKMYDEPCAACALGNSLWNSGRKDDARKFFASWRAFANILVLNRDGSVPEDAEVKVWGMPKTVMESLQAKLKERPKNERGVSNVIDGFNIKVRRTGKGTEDTKYEIDAQDNPSDLPDEAVELLDNMIALDKIYARVDNIHTLLEAPKTVGRPQLTTPISDPWDVEEDEEEKGVVESSYRVIDEEAEAPAAPPQVARAKDKPADPRKAEAQADARARLMAKLKGSQPEDEAEDDEDE